MTLRRLAWRPRDMFRYVVDDEDDKRTNGSAASDGGRHDIVAPPGKDRNDAFASDFRARVGRPSVGRSITSRGGRRRNLLSWDVRGKRRGGEYDAGDDVLSSLDDASRAIVHGSVNGDASRSALHVIVIDEIDAVFGKRSSAEDSGEATRSSTVNQILSNQSRRVADRDDESSRVTGRGAIETGEVRGSNRDPLPVREGRREILNIHFGALRNRGRLSQPLCSAIDGTYDQNLSDGAVSTKMERGRKRRALKKATRDVFDCIYPAKKAAYDLAHDSVTGGFSGAELEGLVRCAGSIALSRAREEGACIESLLITLDDVKQALTEVKV
ncbi:hypothetical protein ACHAW5_008685 [Stephanodiscus triporus]|uniref:Vesicle-fusing ATPase n=1 Tax=Stephanodiscus triporus TaxID=2934178 RepID=A0ABD3PG70_9STRA